MGGDRGERGGGARRRARGLGEENEQGLVLGFHPALVLSCCARGESESDADESWSQRLIRGPRAQ